MQAYRTLPQLSGAASGAFPAATSDAFRPAATLNTVPHATLSLIVTTYAAFSAEKYPFTVSPPGSLCPLKRLCFLKSFLESVVT